MADRSFQNNNLVHFGKDERHEILIQLLVTLVEPSKKVVVFCWGGGQFWQQSAATECNRINRACCLAKPSIKDSTADNSGPVLPSIGW